MKQTSIRITDETWKEIQDIKDVWREDHGLYISTAQVVSMALRVYTRKYMTKNT